MRELFSENNGQLSLVRIMSFLTLITGLFLAVFSLFAEVQVNIIITLLAASFAPKVVQKYAEKVL